MAKLQGSALDLQNYPPQRFRLEQLATDPSFNAALAGKLWLDSANRLKFINGVNIGTLRSTLDALVNGDISAAAAIDPTKIAGTAVITSDSRLTNARTPTGAAGGSLAGNFPNPTIAAGVIGLTELGSGVKPSGGAGVTVEALRALGTGANNAAAGNDPRLSDARTPVAHTHTVSQITDFLATLNARSLSSFLAPTAALSFGGFRATNLAAPTADGDAATKAYVDAAVMGLAPKAAVRARSGTATDEYRHIGGTYDNATGTITQTGANTSAGINDDPVQFDGVTLVQGDRVLITRVYDFGPGGQNVGLPNPAANGIYVVTAVGNPGANWVLTRAPDANTWDELVSAFVFVQEGTTYGDTGWLSTANRGGTLGTTELPWTQFSSAGTITAGSGLVKTGTSIAVALLGITTGMLADAAATAAKVAPDIAGNGLTKSGTGPVSIALDGSGSGLELTGTAPNQTLGIATNGVTNAMLADGAVNLASADVTGALGIPNGGTGATTAAQARANLGITTGGGSSGTFVTKYVNNASHAAGTSFAITAATHGLGAGIYKDVVVRNATTGAEIDVENSVAANGDVTVGPFAESQPANTWAVAIFG